VWADPGGVLPVIDCKIRDISDEGANVAPVNKIEMPDAFTLQLDASRVVGEAKVVWRGPDSVGVELARPKSDEAAD